MFMKEKEKQKKREKEREKGEEKKGKGGGEKKIEKKKRMRDSSDLSGSALSHFQGGFHKALREWIPGFGGRKEGRKMGRIH